MSDEYSDKFSRDTMSQLSLLIDIPPPGVVVAIKVAAVLTFASENNLSESRQIDELMALVPPTQNNKSVIHSLIERFEDNTDAQPAVRLLRNMHSSPLYKLVS